MSETTMPLFPLHTVLVPGYPLALHIFEDRYRQLVRECLASDAPFGVCLIRHGTEVGQPAIPFDVGTVARITEAQQLKDGRYNIVVMGERRFHVRQLLPPAPCLRAVVDILPEEAESPVDASLRKDLEGLAREYVTVLTGASRPVNVRDLPKGAASLSWLLAFLLQAPTREKQGLLEETDPQRRLITLRDLYRRDLMVMRDLQEEPGGASVRPLDGDRLFTRVSPN